MSVNHTSEWTCNRCRTAILTDYGGHPDGWRSMQILDPRGYDVGHAAFHLCAPCVTAHATFMRVIEPTEEEDTDGPVVE